MSDIQANVRERLDEGEVIEKHIGYGDWVWISTDQRVMKYRKSKQGEHSIISIPHGTLSGIERVDAGRKPKYLYIGGGIFAWGLLWVFEMADNTAHLTSQGATGVLLRTLIMYGFILISFIPFGLYAYSDSAYYQFQGVEAAGEDASNWRIDTAGVEDDDLSEFVQSVRYQLYN